MIPTLELERLQRAPTACDLGTLIRLVGRDVSPVMAQIVPRRTLVAEALRQLFDEPHRVVQAVKGHSAYQEEAAGAVGSDIDLTRVVTVGATGPMLIAGNSLPRVFRSRSDRRSIWFHRRRSPARSPTFQLGQWRPSRCIAAYSGVEAGLDLALRLPLPPPPATLETDPVLATAFNTSNRKSNRFARAAAGSISLK